MESINRGGISYPFQLTKSSPINIAKDKQGTTELLPLTPPKTPPEADLLARSSHEVKRRNVFVTQFELNKNVARSDSHQRAGIRPSVDSGKRENTVLQGFISRCEEQFTKCVEYNPKEKEASFSESDYRYQEPRLMWSKNCLEFYKEATKKDKVQILPTLTRYKDNLEKCLKEKCFTGDNQKQAEALFRDYKRYTEKYWLFNF